MPTLEPRKFYYRWVNMLLCMSTMWCNILSKHTRVDARTGQIDISMYIPHSVHNEAGCSRRLDSVWDNENPVTVLGYQQYRWGWIGKGQEIQNLFAVEVWRSNPGPHRGYVTLLTLKYLFWGNEIFLCLDRGTYISAYVFRIHKIVALRELLYCVHILPNCVDYQWKGRMDEGSWWYCVHPGNWHLWLWNLQHLGQLPFFLCLLRL